MEDYQLILNAITKNNALFSREKVKKVLVIFDEEKKFFLGDCCVRFDRLRYLRDYYSNAAIDINFPPGQSINQYMALLKNNPNVNSILPSTYEDVDFQQYDVIICVSYHEERIMEHFVVRYSVSVKNGEFKIAVFSMSKPFLDPDGNGVFVFPVNYDILNFVKTPKPLQLFISQEEKAWGEKWLEENGVTPDDSLFVLLDSTTSNLKLLKIWVYFEFLGHLLKRKNVKIINFDENDIGKEGFYREWLGDENIDKMIFSKKLSLREVFCIISSKYTKFVFGPCTGIMHCTSSIYNKFFDDGVSRDQIPLIVTYTGTDYLKNQSVNSWWGNSPLVNCLLLKRSNGENKITVLRSLPEEERNQRNEIPCSEYTSEMLIGYIDKVLIS
ncbi:glycosyltransferase family 9 protein [Mucilaginibacter angelicae]|uniref:Glycosyltransferase family 9 protein n=1 Tax=Mucilaginibacter angelicae TaxID=869718 RepID=A0ABV6LA76_9SPHI